MPAIDTTKAFKDLPESDVSYQGASGDGNDPPITDLKRGYSLDAEENKMPMADMFPGAKGGFLGRAKGWER